MTKVEQAYPKTYLSFRNDFIGPLSVGRCVELLATRGFSVHFGRGPDFMGLRGGDGAVVAVVDSPDGDRYAIAHSEPFDKLPLQDLLAKGLTHFVFDHVDMEAQ